jgi:glycosyltransferase involved in cell wall biosynthesis
MQINLYYAGQTDQSGFGWATCNSSLVRELRKICTVYTQFVPGDKWKEHDMDIPVFMPLADHDLNPISWVRGKHNFAYTFFEYELGPNAAANAAKYDVVFCGSTWCLERMKERGITNGRVLIQGVDHEIFKPMPVARTDNEFRIFSGGKFEYRKGQDIVIAAFRELSKKYHNMRLVCAWHNPWPQLIQSMRQSPHFDHTEWPLSDKKPQAEYLHLLAVKQGVPHDKITVLPPLSQADLAAVMNQTDLGVFPNRCEGGTNLVAMEYLNCGKPAALSAGTGHEDILRECASAIPVFGNACKTGWVEVRPSGLEMVIEAEMDDPSNFVADGIKDFTWERAARTILETVVEFQ